MARHDPNPGEEIIIGYPSFHEGQRMVNDEADAVMAQTGGMLEAYLCGHRGWWKSSFMLRRLLLNQRKYRTDPAAWYAPTLTPIKDTQENLFKKAIEPSDWERFYHHTDKILRLPRMGSIHFYSLLDDDAGRGPTFPFIVGDEWGTLPDGVHHKVIKPIMRKAQLAYRRSEGWFMGTPNASGNPMNHFYDSLMLGKSRKYKSMIGWIISASARYDEMTDTLVYEKNPYANNGYLFENMLQDFDEDKPGFMIEWLCKFISLSGVQFGHDAVERQCCLPTESVMHRLTDTSLKPLPLAKELRDTEFVTYRQRGSVNKKYSWGQIGVDIGVDQNKFSLHALDRETMQQVYAHHFLPFGSSRWFMIYEAIALAHRMFPSFPIIVDDNGIGNHIIESMRRNYGIIVKGCKFGRTNKEPILDHASSMVEESQVELFNLDFIKTEMKAVKRIPKADGSGFIIKATGKKVGDDAPMAISLMLLGVFSMLTEQQAIEGLGRMIYSTEPVADMGVSVSQFDPNAGGAWYDFLSIA